MNTEKTIDALNELVQINNDRINGYETASKEAEETDLKMLFSHFTETSLKCKSELSAEIIRLGGKPTEGTTNSGKFFRVWMDIKASLTGKNRKLILDSCEFGEEAAVETYKDVLENSVEDLTSEQLMMVRNQYQLIQADHDKVVVLWDLMKVSN